MERGQEFGLTSRGEWWYREREKEREGRRDGRSGRIRRRTYLSLKKEKRLSSYIYGHVVFEMLLDLLRNVVAMYNFEAQEKSYICMYLYD